MSRYLQFFHRVALTGRTAMIYPAFALLFLTSASHAMTTLNLSVSSEGTEVVAAHAYNDSYWRVQGPYSDISGFTPVNSGSGDSIPANLSRNRVLLRSGGGSVKLPGCGADGRVTTQGFRSCFPVGYRAYWSGFRYSRLRAVQSMSPPVLMSGYDIAASAASFIHDAIGGHAAAVGMVGIFDHYADTAGYTVFAPGPSASPYVVANSLAALGNREARWHFDQCSATGLPEGDSVSCLGHTIMLLDGHQNRISATVTDASWGFAQSASKQSSVSGLPVDDEYNQVVLAFNHWSGRSHGTISMGKNNVPVIVSYNVVTERGTLPGQVMMNVSTHPNTTCTVGINTASIDFGNVDPRYKPEMTFTVTGTCDGPIDDPDAYGLEPSDTVNNMFRVQVSSASNNYISCSAPDRCVPFVDESGEEDGTGVYFSTSSGSIVNEGDNQIHSRGYLDDITSSSGGSKSRTIYVTLYPANDNSTPTLGEHTANAVMELWYD